MSAHVFSAPVTNKPLKPCRASSQWVSSSYNWTSLKPSVVSFKPAGVNHQVSNLVGGLEHGFYDFPIILGMSSSQLTFIFFRGVETTNQ